MATITSNGTGGGVWSAGATWVGGVAPVDNDTVVIAAGDTVIFDVNMSAYPNGIAGITITSGSTTPAMLSFATTGTNYLKLKTGNNIAGTNNTVRGRLLVNSDGVWGNTGALPYTTKATIEMGLTGKILGLYLDIALYCYQPTVLSATVYNTIQTVNNINTETNVITLGASHGWSAGTAVMVTSDGTYPGGLFADTVYYVRSPSGADLLLALQNNDTTLVDITSSGSGIIRIFDGHTSTSTATINVLEDLTSVTGWTTTDGYDRVVLADVGAPLDSDQQRLGLTTINANSLVLSANVDSVQYPGAKVWLVSRNVSILSSCTTWVYLVDYGVGTHGGVFQCEIRSTAGTGTTYYGTGIKNGNGHTISGTVSGCLYGFDAGIGHAVSGIISACSIGIAYGTGHTISGTVSGCSNGIYGGIGHAVSGTVSGCSNGINAATLITVSGKIVGCSIGVRDSTGNTVSGTIAGCGSGISAGTGHEISGAISGCNYGINTSTMATVSGTISGCNYGINAGIGWLNGATLYWNTIDMYPNGGYWQGWGVTLSGTTQCTYYKHSQIDRPEKRNFGVAILNLGDIDEYIGFWTLGGYTRSVVYSVGTHGTPPKTLSLVHEATFEDNERFTWAEIPFWVNAGSTYNITFYGKLTGTTAFTILPTVGIYDPTKTWQSVEEVLIFAQMAAHTDWQTFLLTYTALTSGELRMRVQGKGGLADGTGIEKLYWYHTLESTVESDWTTSEKQQIRQALGLTGTTTATTGTGNLDDVITAFSTLNDITVADIIAGISEGSLDFQEMLRIILAAVAGKASGGGTSSIAFRDQADTKNRISMTVDSSGNRAFVTVDGT